MKTFTSSEYENRKQALSLLILLLSISFISAQRPAKKYLFEVRGKVVDAERVPYGAMHLRFLKDDGFSDSALSDGNGNFSIKFPPGKYQIKTSDLASTDLNTFIEITENGLNPTGFELVVELNKNWCANCPDGKMPEATSAPAPPYPPVAKAVAAAGEVVVEITFDQTGKVLSAAAVSGHPLLRAVSRQCALNWKFSPDETIPVRKGKLIFAFGGAAGPELFKYRKPNRLEILAPSPTIDY